MEKTIILEDNQEAQALLGPHDHNIKEIERKYKVKVFLKGEHLKLSGSLNNVNKACGLIEYLLDAIRAGQPEVGRLDMHHLMNDFMKEKNYAPEVQDVPSVIGFMPQKEKSAKSRTIQPKTKGQREYVEAIKKYDIVFGIGPAGTGKTYLAMASAVEALKNQEVRRIILTRPAIEAGESLGFLPGDVYEKISPYLRPLYDALYDMMDAERIEKYIETGIIEVAPLAYMRGRTLNDAFIILDEAQNATAEQMKMFLTRLGFDSKVVITGDITQSDLPEGKPIGLLHAQDILKDIEGIKFTYFTGFDVVRHELVQKIIEAYEKASRDK
ncbi:MAG: PhoH family protein [Candidatus Omnitrophica bacterium]|nr:PhoH family protein [Candidatus Omnitrophota bacterium]